MQDDIDIICLWLSQSFRRVTDKKRISGALGSAPRHA
jgi:hypothetical protein